MAVIPVYIDHHTTKKKQKKQDNGHKVYKLILFQPLDHASHGSQGSTSRSGSHSSLDSSYYSANQ